MDSTAITPVLPVGGSGDGMFGGNTFMYIFGLLILLGFFSGGFGGFGGNRDVATKDFVTDSINNQSTQASLQNILLSSANNNYETAQLISNQSAAMMAQNNTNLVNAIQGFNQLGSKIDQLGYHLDQCCCDIKTQMLQNRLDDAQAALVTAQGNISNANQSQYILSQLGRFVAWTPSGTQAAASAG